MSELYRDFIDSKADEIITDLGGTITPAPSNTELYRDFLGRKFDDVINACNGLIKVKSFKYTGTGTIANHRIDLPDDCKIILAILPSEETVVQNYNFITLNSNVPILPPGSLLVVDVLASSTTTALNLHTVIHIKFKNGYILTENKNNSSTYNLNKQDVEYTVYYI